MNTTCLLHPFTNKYQPHTVCYPHDKGSSCCQEMSVCLWQKEKKKKKKNMQGCQESCLYLMWNDTYMTAKSEHNCSLNNEKKWSQWLQPPSFPPFPFCVFLVTLKIVKSLSWKEKKHLKWWRWMVCHLFYSLEDVQFQFGLNAFAWSLRMVGQCVSG